MHDEIPKTGKWVRSVVNGYYNYHAVPGNGKRLQAFRGAERTVKGQPMQQVFDHRPSQQAKCRQDDESTGRIMPVGQPKARARREQDSENAEPRPHYFSVQRMPDLPIR
jgi:hypothetical protein